MTYFIIVCTAMSKDHAVTTISLLFIGHCRNTWLLWLQNSCCELMYTNTSNYAVAWSEFCSDCDPLDCNNMQSFT
jgi:hypothetical protein